MFGGAPSAVRGDIGAPRRAREKGESSMDSMEINKFVGAIVGALLIYLGVNFFTEMAFDDAHHDGEHHYAYAVEIEEDAGGAAEEEVSFADLMANANPDKGAKLFGKCKACHKLDGSNSTGPALNGIVDRAIASVEGFGYSGALQGLGGDWTLEALDGFIAKPKDYAPGTKMSFAGLKKPEQRADLIAYLQSVE